MSPRCQKLTPGSTYVRTHARTHSLARSLTHYRPFLSDATVMTPCRICETTVARTFPCVRATNARTSSTHRYFLCRSCIDQVRSYRGCDAAQAAAAAAANATDPGRNVNESEVGGQHAAATATLPPPDPTRQPPHRVTVPPEVAARIENHVAAAMNNRFQATVNSVIERAYDNVLNERDVVSDEQRAIEFDEDMEYLRNMERLTERVRNL